MKLWDWQTILDKGIHSVPHARVLALCIACPSKQAKVNWLPYFERRFIDTLSCVALF